MRCRCMVNMCVERLFWIKSIRILIVCVYMPVAFGGILACFEHVDPLAAAAAGV